MDICCHVSPRDEGTLSRFSLVCGLVGYPLLFATTYWLAALAVVGVSLILMLLIVLSIRIDSEERP